MFLFNERQLFNEMFPRQNVCLNVGKNQNNTTIKSVIWSAFWNDEINWCFLEVVF